MAKQIILVPDIGDYSDVPVIEVLIKVGDVIEKEQPLLVLESDKATMEIPADAAGTVLSISVKAGDKVAKGSVVAEIEVGAATTAPQASAPAVSAVPAQ
jgi:dihydrolipoamide dehydrogenase